jgi:segregation and condensation protein B
LEATKVSFSLVSVIETLLFITDRPLSLKRIGELAKEKNLSRIEVAIKDLEKDLEDRKSALRILEIAGGFQMATQSKYSSFIRRLFADKMTLKLSRAAHETISIIAYRQPLTRAEIEMIRGVDVIAALETLLEKKLIRVAGRKETIGRPLMYETTPDFLRHFGLKNLDELPPIENFESHPVPQAASEPLLPVQDDEPGTVPQPLKDEPQLPIENSAQE